MRTLYLTIPLVAFTLSACETADQNAVAGAATGALVGAAVSGDDDRLTGALVGAAVGTAASVLIRPTGNGQCLYRNSAGQTFTAAC
jgi:gas vesicle protein